MKGVIVGPVSVEDLSSQNILYFGNEKFSSMTQSTFRLLTFEMNSEK